MKREEFRYVSLLIDDDRSGSEFHEPTCFNYMYTILFYYIFSLTIDAVYVFRTMFVCNIVLKPKSG